MRDAEWVKHEEETGHTDRVDTLVPTGWQCKQCKAKSSNLVGGNGR